MKNLRNYISELLEKGKREDGRSLLEYRNISVEVNPIKQANGSARVRLGDTEVVVGVKFGVGAPFPDSPEEGILMTSAEHPPMASSNFEAGPPREEAIEFSRVVDRIIRESGAIDFSKLVITPREKVWMIFIDAYPINDGGNLFDATAIGALVALKNAYLPKYDKKNDKLEHKEITKNKLKLNQIPILCTFGKIGNSLFADPDLNEESVIDASLNIGTIENGDICAMQKGGVVGFSEDEIKILVSEAIKKSKDLRKFLKKYL